MVTHQTTPAKELRVGTRGSLLARTQTGQVIEQLRARWPGLEVQVITITSSGDTIQDRPLHEFGGKGLFTKELEQALLDGRIDLAVHSLKDLPVTMPLVDVSGLGFISPVRADARDLLVSRQARRIEDLRPAAKVGTGSLRRKCQILALRPDLDVQGVRGNIDTRLRKAREGMYDAVILAAAGVQRAGLFDDKEMALIPVETMIPAAGQAALALQFRKEDAATKQIARGLEDEATMTCVSVEREVVRGLGGDCHSPIAAYATLDGGRMRLVAAVGGADGLPPVRIAEVAGAVNETARIVSEVVARLRQ